MSVVVVPYNPEWPSYFEKIKAELTSYLVDVEILSIEHVGSTSVPGLAAKPIIDIDIIVTRSNVQPAIDALVNASFLNLGELGITDRHALKDPNQSPKRNIYVCVADAFQTRNHLALRDTLRSNPSLRDEYAAVKLQLAAEDTNIIDYISGKSFIVQKILKAAGLLNDDELVAIKKANSGRGTFGATKTERLLLREFIMDDVQPLSELEGKAEVVRYQTRPPWTREQAWEEVGEIIRDATVIPRSHIELAVEHEKRFIGRVGAKIKRDGEDGALIKVPHADLWYSFEPEYQGKGYATEAMKKFIELLPKPLELEIECDPRNTGSWKLAERLEFEKISLIEKAFKCKGEWVDSLVYQKRI
ncbi:acyl-CoA N-acyltransferase [Periconia macrospinosa]|uniref:Acyl-CoA N-acyltransferase n=1 Tax=Periconia macrospinosa TaxID=97972 RepID=A0A2V1ED06_9PLEO|nr:acyl-CoA N-acyltransferase [Periconia macrospinosa]